MARKEGAQPVVWPWIEQSLDKLDSTPVIVGALHQLQPAAVLLVPPTLLH